MGKAADPSPRKRGKVEALLKLGTFSQRDFAKEVGISHKAVFTISERLKKTGSSSPKRANKSVFRC